MTGWLPGRVARLVDDVRDGGRQRQLAELAGLAGYNPRSVAELAVELAARVAELEDERDLDHAAHGPLERLLGARQPQPGELPTLIAREAHRLHWRGVRPDWVLWGERLYQRLIKQRQREQGPVT